MFAHFWSSSYEQTRSGDSASSRSRTLSGGTRVSVAMVHLSKVPMSRSGSPMWGRSARDRAVMSGGSSEAGDPAGERHEQEGSDDRPRAGEEAEEQRGEEPPLRPPYSAHD